MGYGNQPVPQKQETARGSINALNTEFFSLGILTKLLTSPLL